MNASDKLPCEVVPGDAMNLSWGASVAVAVVVDPSGTGRTLRSIVAPFGDGWTQRLSWTRWMTPGTALAWSAER